MTLAMASEPNSADCGPRTISMRSRSPAARMLNSNLPPGSFSGIPSSRTWLFELEMPQRIGEGAFDFSAIWLQQTHGCARDRGAVRIENGSGNLSLLSPNGEREDT